jgi:exodeoxyribonuclease VII large subunit
VNILKGSTHSAYLEETSVFTVSELNAQIKGLLEHNYRLVWVVGEISNFRVPASGHYYFTLKDEQSQIRAVFFRPQHRHLRFVPQSGLQVVCQGRVSVYEPRGEYQIIVETMEPQGLGALQLAFEQLKKKLEAEGLFDPSRRLPLPFCPQRIGVVTSPTGAAVRDILKVLQRSPYPLSVTILPVRVQGAEASLEIASAIAGANETAGRFQWDLLIVGRGGGSIEDLWSFNEEIVARAIAASSIPVISAVGHEIDFTIADLVADLRAPTPTAAAEWIVGQLDRFERELSACRDRALRAMAKEIADQGSKIRYLEKRLVDPRRRLEDMRLFVDDRLERLQMALSRRIEKLQAAQGHLAEKLQFLHPVKNIQQYRLLVDRLQKELVLHQSKILEISRFQVQKWGSQLDGLSPLAVLERGYSITYRLPDMKVVRTSEEVRSGQEIRVKLASGALECFVRKSERETDSPS